MVLAPLAAGADELEITVTGVEGVPKENVEAHVGSRWVSGTALSSSRRRERFMNDARARASRALRPYGYYAPTIETRLEKNGDKAWRLLLEVDPGEPVTVRELVLEVHGPGAGIESLESWQRNWPLKPGTRLDQPLWDESKDTALELAEEQGYLSASFSTSRIGLDLESNRADLALVLDTGPRAMMGEVVFEQGLVEDGVLRPVPRFRAGEPYQAWLVEKLRTDLWRSGYWDEIDVTEDRRLDQDPPVVHFRVALKEDKPNTHQGTIGYGTDTEFRMQYRWQRYYLSERGDSLSSGFGWQSRQEELILFGEYRLPRQVSTAQYWQIVPLLKREHQDLDIEISGNGDEDAVRVASGRVDDLTLRFGRVKLHNLSFSREQIIETVYGQYLRESDDFGFRIPSGLLPPDAGEEPSDFGPLNNIRRSLAVGMEWDWPVVQGSGFQTRGHRERAWIFTSNKAWGSDVDYSQIYLSTRWEIPFAARWKVLLRGEAGYSDADVFDAELELEDQTLLVSITELPYLYRFKAGGSQSVRGYDYEQLSNNGIGSNNILTASTEVEYQFTKGWSAAAFVDVGNAFNDWSDTKLKTGIGLGIRWYTIAGALRLDLAQALDIDGHPWRVHITIGTPLL